MPVRKPRSGVQVMAIRLVASKTTRDMPSESVSNGIDQCCSRAQTDLFLCGSSYSILVLSKLITSNARDNRFRVSSISTRAFICSTAHIDAQLSK